MTLAEIARLKSLALQPDVQIWTLREAVCLLGSELEILMREHAKQREHYLLARRALSDLQVIHADPSLR